MTHVIDVPFRGDGSGSQELTWGQWTVWRMMQDFGSPFMIGGAMKLDEGTTLDGLVHLLSFIVSRHQSLRTRIRVGDDGEPMQVLSDAGEVGLEVVDIADDEDPAEAADAVRRRIMSEPFDIAEDWPVRMAVVRRGGVPDHFVALYPHMAIDAYGFDALIDDLANLDRETGAHLAPRGGIQPLELARQQQGVTALRQGEASLRYWEKCLRTIPARRFNGPYEPRSPRWWNSEYDSPAGQMAVTAISARTGLHSGPIILAAYAVSMARVTGVNPSVFRMIISNRYRPDFAKTVAVVGEPGLCVIDVGDCTFDEAVARAWRSQIAAGKNGYYDPRKMWELRDKIDAERGVVDLMAYHNDRRKTMAQPVATEAPDEAAMWDAVPRSRFTWGDRSDVPDVGAYLDVNGSADSVNLALLGDTRSVSPTEQVAILRGIEEVLLAAAFDPGYRTGV